MSTCSLDTHPLVEDIDEMLRGGKTHGVIRSFIIDNGEVPPERYALSRHAKHIGLAPRSQGNPKTSSGENTSEELPDLQTIAQEALRVFYRRLMHEPDKVSTRDLIPLVQVILKQAEIQHATTNLEEELRQIADAAKNP